MATAEQEAYCEKRRIDEEFENWLSSQGIGDNQLPEVNDMLDDMIASQKRIKNNNVY